MFEEMKKRDWGVLVVLVAVTLAISAYASSVPADPTGAFGLLEQGPTVVLGFTLLVSAVLMYKYVSLYGGEIGRAFTIMMIGFIISSVRAPYIVWHFAGITKEPFILGPSWLGVHQGFWAGFLHMLMLHGVVLILYGFYLLMKVFQEE
jgi:hypothetical protein